MLDKERHLLFSLNAIDEMQDKFGGFDRLDTVLSGKDSIKNLRWLLTVLLNEGAANSAVVSFISDPISRREEFILVQAARYSFSPVRSIDVLICSSFAIYIPPSTSSISTSFGTGLKRSGLNSR